MAIRGNFGFTEIILPADVRPTNRPKYINLGSEGSNQGKNALQTMITLVQLANTQAGGNYYSLIQYECVGDSLAFATYGIAQNIVDFPVINDQALTPA